MEREGGNGERIWKWRKRAFIELAPYQRNREEKKHTNIKKNLRVNKHVCFEPKWGIVVREN